LRAKLIILAAGALRTPQILLNSSSVDWPSGLANDSGLVGRNLMRHFVDLYAISTKSRYITGHMKEIALNDFYFNDGLKLGTVQSFGHLPPPGILVDAIALELKEKSVFLALFFNAMKPFIRIALSWLLSKKVILVSILEDLPYLDNRVSINKENNQLVINYRINQQSSSRIEIFRDKMKKMLKPYRFMQLKQAESNDRIAHACGTCRFGDDPKESVLDRFNRAHGINNLYVVDSSFFPTSGGTNPSLTIAANALRVADHIINNDLLLADNKEGK
jgi:choline dehydrogenase-like flavoprotein